MNVNRFNQATYRRMRHITNVAYGATGVLVTVHVNGSVRLHMGTVGLNANIPVTSNEAGKQTAVV